MRGTDGHLEPHFDSGEDGAPVGRPESDGRAAPWGGFDPQPHFDHGHLQEGKA